MTAETMAVILAGFLLGIYLYPRKRDPLLRLLWSWWRRSAGAPRIVHYTNNFNRPEDWIAVWSDGVISVGGYAECPSCGQKCYGRCAALEDPGAVGYELAMWPVPTAWYLRERERRMARHG